jgi:hypothetical protein
METVATKRECWLSAHRNGTYIAGMLYESILTQSPEVDKRYFYEENSPVEKLRQGSSGASAMA